MGRPSAGLNPSGLDEGGGAGPLILSMGGGMPLGGPLKGGPPPWGVGPRGPIPRGGGGPLISGGGELG